MNKTDKQKYLSDILNTSDIERIINSNLRLGIHTGTGTGKTSFINKDVREYLRENNMRGLFVSARKNIVEQQEHDSKTNEFLLDTVIDFTTIQKITNKLNYDSEVDIAASYDLLIIDEYHHIISDSKFNETIYKFQQLVNELDLPVIFISATPNKLNNIFKLDNVITDSSLGIEDYKYEDTKVYRYQEDIFNELEKVLYNTNDKVLVYVNNSEIIKQLYNRFSDIDSLVVCSESQSKLKDYRDGAAIRDLLINNKTHHRMILATKTLDSGVNIIDEDLKHIFIFSYDVQEIRQVAARKRITKRGEKVMLYVKNYTPKELGYIKQDITKSLQQIDYLHNDIKKFDNLVSTYQINKSLFIVENGRFVVNEVFHEFLLEEQETLNRIEQFGFLHELERVGIYGLDVEEERNKENLDIELGKMYDNQLVCLAAKDRKPIIDLISFKENGRIRKDIDKLNGYLESLDCKYRIEQFATNRIQPNGKNKRFRSAWRLIKLD